MLFQQRGCLTVVAAQQDKQLTFMHEILAVLKCITYLELLHVNARFLHWLHMFELRERVVVVEQWRRMLYKSSSFDIMSMIIFFF